jgi:hypothetical protein
VEAFTIPSQCPSLFSGRVGSEAKIKAMPSPPPGEVLGVILRTKVVLKEAILNGSLYKARPAKLDIETVL